ncbi:MAG: hypothetical protein IT181_10555 [Acidobacteria bacterium]|nr:hypothetical protein [Acidobacteriota bacterium]
MTRSTPLYAGLGLTMLATLLLEIVDSRLLSVVTWYHLSFVAISVAMLGAAAGAVAVFVSPARFPLHDGPRQLATWAARFAMVLPISHLLSLVIPMPDGQQWTSMDLVVLALSLGVIATPFALGGIVTTLALTRTQAPVGRLYAADLLGAAIGCLAAVALLDTTNLSAAAFAATAVAALGALAFRRAAGLSLGLAVPVTLVLALVAMAGNVRGEAVRVMYPKNRLAWNKPVLRSLWNSHAHILAFLPEVGPAFYWGGGDGAAQFTNNQAFVVVDGEAGTPMTEWDGNPASLDWVSYDVTALPYQLRKAGRVGIVGVGGGRDILAAIWSRSPSITAVEINSNVVALLTEHARRFTKIADHPGVTLVHDEGRAYLTRSREQFDVLQMSLVDTWAATGAGAFTLSENGLYTREAWKIFLDRLTPTGIISVARWFSQGQASETSRLIALAVGALIDRGAAAPQQHLALVARGNVATLMVSPTPLSSADLDALDAACAARGFTVLASSRVPAADARLAAILAASSSDALTIAATDATFDYQPPTDARPFFFNMLKPRAWLAGMVSTDGGVIAGNLRATGTLVAILAVSLVFVAGAIVLPLVVRGRPALPGGSLAAGLTYFTLIGTAFMCAQVAFLQRFSVLLGHPTYALVVVLFSMILFAGLGSFVSERAVGARGERFGLFTWVLAAGLAATAVSIAGICASAVAWSTTARVATVLAIVAPLSLLMGFCFPHGARLVQSRDESALAWMWGANGAAGVVASIAAVMISMTLGIEANLWVAVACYAVLPLVAAGVATLRPSVEAAAGAHAAGAGARHTADHGPHTPGATRA